MKQWKFLLVVATVVAPLVPAEAQVRSSAQGFFVGAGANGSALRLDDERRESGTAMGGGVSFQLGYNFTPRVGVVLNGAGASVSKDEDQYTLRQGDLGVRFMLTGPGSSFVPYVDLAYTALRGTADFGTETAEVEGSGLTGALGLHYFFTRRFAFDLNGRYTKGEFDTITIRGTTFTGEDGFKVTTARANIGFAFFP